jgi:hypothetical protein
LRLRFSAEPDVLDVGGRNGNSPELVSRDEASGEIEPRGSSEEEFDRDEGGLENSMSIGDDSIRRPSVGCPLNSDASRSIREEKDA